MRRVPFAYAVLLTLLLIELGVSAAIAEPKLALIEPVYEFGAVPQGDRIKHRFVFRNSGDSTLEIQRVVPSCGCTVSKLEKDRLEPGEETGIAVDFDTRGMSGVKVKTVRVYTNDPGQLTALLTLQGEVLPELIVDPPRINFGEVLREEGEGSAFVEREVSMKVRPGARARIDGIVSRSKWVQVESLESSDKELRAKVRLSKEVNTGEFRDRIVIKLSGEGAKTINLPLYASVVGKLQVKPQAVAFGIVKGQSKVVSQFRVLNRSKEALRVVNYTSDSPAVSLSLTEEVPGKEFVVAVELDQSQVKKDMKSAIRMKFESIGQKRSEELSVAVTAVLPPKFLNKSEG